MIDVCHSQDGSYLVKGSEKAYNPDYTDLV